MQREIGSNTQLVTHPPGTDYPVITLVFDDINGIQFLVPGNVPAVNSKLTQMAQVML